MSNDSTLLDIIDQAQTAQDALQALGDLASTATGTLSINGNGLAILLSLIGDKFGNSIRELERHNRTFDKSGPMGL